MFTPDNPDLILRKELLPSEKLLWTGRPDSQAAGKRGIPMMIMGIPLTAIILAMTAGTIWITIVGKLGPAALIVGIFLLPFYYIMGVLLTAPFWQASKARRTYYGLTDQRALIVEEGKQRSTQAFSLSDLGAPYVIGQGDLADLAWSKQPASTYLSTTTNSISGPMARKLTASTTGQWQASTATIDAPQASFTFICLKEVQAALEVAKTQNATIVQEQQKADPLGLEELRTVFSQGKLFVYDGMDMYEFDGQRVVGRKNIYRIGIFIIGGFFLLLGAFVALNVATTLAKPGHGGLLEILPQAGFVVFLLIAVFNVVRQPGLKKQFAAPTIDFNDSRVITKLQQIYQKQNLTYKKPSPIQRIIQFIIAIAVLGGFAAMLSVPFISSYQQFKNSGSKTQSTGTGSAAAGASMPLTKRILYYQALARGAAEDLAAAPTRRKRKDKSLSTT